MPVANRRPSACRCPNASAANRHTPARVSSSGHGSRPGLPGLRCSTWHAFEGAPTFTKRAPSPPNAMLLAVCDREAGRSATTISASPAGSSAPAVHGNRLTTSLVEKYR